MGLKRVRHNLVTEKQGINLKLFQREVTADLTETSSQVS